MEIRYLKTSKLLCHKFWLFCIVTSFNVKRQLKIKVLFALLAFGFYPSIVKAQINPPTYVSVSIYICAHQDDWQLFMGSNVYNDLQEFDSISPNYSKRKVVIIYTTAGNLHDDDDTKTCECKDPNDLLGQHIPYWKVREKGSKNSLHLSACRVKSVGPGIPYPENRVDVINGHPIANYHFKNTSSYYLRIKAGQYGRWTFNPDTAAGTVDSASTYVDWADFVNTLYYIYKKEMSIDVPGKNPSFYFPDINEDNNPNDHPDHYLAGKGAYEAAKMLGDEWHTCFPESLFVDYNTQNLPENLDAADAANKAAVTGAYCLALLDHNAWAEWGGLYREWTKRSYYRIINSCEQPRHSSTITADGLDKPTAKLFPNPADKQLQIKFNLPLKSEIAIKITDVIGAEVYSAKTMLDGDNTLTVSTSNLPIGSYLAIITAGPTTLSKIIFEVVH